MIGWLTRRIRRMFLRPMVEEHIVRGMRLAYEPTPMPEWPPCICCCGVSALTINGVYSCHECLQNGNVFDALERMTVEYRE